MRVPTCLVEIQPRELVSYYNKNKVSGAIRFIPVSLIGPRKFLTSDWMLQEKGGNRAKSGQLNRFIDKVEN
jgi:hypothetical protein